MPYITLTPPLPTAELNDMHPAVIQFYSTKTLLAGVINASYFETEGWNAPQHNYEWTFDPSSGWNNMSAGRVMISFEGDEKRTGCFLKDLLAHNLKITPPAGWADPPPYTPPNKGKARAVDPNRTQEFPTDDSSDEELRAYGKTPPPPAPHSHCIAFSIRPL